MLRVLLALALVAGCDKSRQPPEPATPVATAADAARTPSAPVDPSRAPRVVFVRDDGAEVGVTVELAATENQRRDGLMWRQYLADDAGMLFLFREDEVHSFWMKNTLIPLDMIFLRADGTVAGVVENAEPRTLTSRSIGRASRHVLEVNGGWARRNGVGAGTRARFENVNQERIE